MADQQDASRRKGSLPSLERSQLAITLFRDGIIVLLFLLLLIAPAFINDRLVNAGFDEGNFAGLRWKRQVVAADVELKEARVQITRLRERLGATQHALVGLQTSAPPAAAAAVQQIRRENARVEQTSRASIRSIEQSIARTDRVVAEAAEAISDDPRWVVISSDPTPSGARDEIAQRQNSSRSVTIFPDRATALAYLPHARALGLDAYAVSLASWCLRRREAGDFSACD